MDDDSKPGTYCRTDVQARDEAGLTLIQKKLLVSLLEENNWRKACEVNDVSLNYFRRALQEDEAFRLAYDNLLKGVLRESRSKLVSLMPKVGEVMEEGLDADKEMSVPATCPECAHTFAVVAQLPHWAVKLRVVESLLKAQGMATQRFIHEGRIEHRDMTLEDLIARARYQRGEGIPPDVEEELRARGLLGEQPSAQDSASEQEPPIEAEYTVKDEPA